MLLLIMIIMCWSQISATEISYIPDQTHHWCCSGGSNGDDLPLGYKLSLGDRFGRSLSYVGDLNGDGINDIVVGSYRDGDGGKRAGALYVLLMETNSSVRYTQKISALYGGLKNYFILKDEDMFGQSVCGIGDLNGDGTGDIAVGAAGHVYILLLNSNGTIFRATRVSSFYEGFGMSVNDAGDLDGDGFGDLVVSSNEAMHVFYMTGDGTFKSEQILNKSTFFDTERDIMFSGITATLRPNLSSLLLIVGWVYTDMQGTVYLTAIHIDSPSLIVRNISSVFCNSSGGVSDIVSVGSVGEDGLPGVLVAMTSGSIALALLTEQLTALKDTVFLPPGVSTCKAFSVTEKLTGDHDRRSLLCGVGGRPGTVVIIPINLSVPLTYQPSSFPTSLSSLPDPSHMPASKHSFVLDIDTQDFLLGLLLVVVICCSLAMASYLKVEGGKERKDTDTHTTSCNDDIGSCGMESLDLGDEFEDIPLSSPPLNE